MISSAALVMIVVITVIVIKLKAGLIFAARARRIRNQEEPVAQQGSEEVACS